MTASTSKASSRRSGRLFALLVLGASLAACGKSGSSGGAATVAPAKLDACALVTDSMLGKYAPGLGEGHPGAIPKKSLFSTCVWSDSHRLPALILTVGPSDPSGIAQGLMQDLGKTGYKIVSVPGLGDEAAVAIQEADPKLHTKTGIATLTLRVGKRQLGYSPIEPAIQGVDAPAFGRLKELAAETAKRLRQSD